MVELDSPEVTTTPPATPARGRLVVEWYALLVISTLMLSGLLLSGATTRLDNALYDVALRLRHQPPPPSNIVVVGIDFPSMTAKGNWPWPRGLQADMLRNIARDHPKAVAWLFLYQSKGLPQDDQKLHDAIASAPVYLPEALESPGKGHAGILTRPTPFLASAAAGLGRATGIPDIDGIVRRTFLFERHDNEILPEMMQAVAGENEASLTAYANRNRGAAGVSAVDHRDEILIPFSGPPGHYLNVSASKVVDGAMPAGFFKDKYVLVGATAPGLLDNYPTPVSRADGMPNIEIEANILDAMLHHHLIRAMPMAENLALSLGVVWVLFLGFLQLQPNQLVISGIGGSLLFLAGSIASLLFFGLWFPPMSVVITRSLIQVIWSSRRLQAASDYFARELSELQTRAGGAILGANPAADRIMGDSVSRQMMLIDETRQRVRELRRFVTDVLANFPDPVIVASPPGRIIAANGAATTLGRRLGRSTDVGAQLQPILEDLENAAENSQKLWPPDTTPGATPPRGVGPGGRILEARYTPTGFEGEQVRGWTVHLVDVTDLVSAMRQREEVLQLFTHDMRSPQSAILAALDHKDFQGVPRNLRDSIEKNALRTLSLADGFVRLAQAEASEYAFEPIDLFHVVTDAADALWPTAQSATVDIVIEDPGREYVVDADRSLLARALINLLDNAIKFSPAGRSVVCAFAEATLRGGPAVALTITDQASGMSQEQQKSLFKRFARSPGTGDPAELKKVRSNSIGLGLAVVHTVVTRHDGLIDCRSEIGEGTTFTITLPLREGDEDGDGDDDAGDVQNPESAAVRSSMIQT